MKPLYKTPEETNPINQEEDVQKSNDRHIDQDFEGYPHTPAQENIINPKSTEDKIIAGVKDGENIAQGAQEIKKQKRNRQKEEINSDGSANAFERTEGMPDKAEEKQHDKLKIDERSKVY
jgi:hypothetical protein